MGTSLKSWILSESFLGTRSFGEWKIPQPHDFSHLQGTTSPHRCFGKLPAAQVPPLVRNPVPEPRRKRRLRIPLWSFVRWVGFITHIIAYIYILYIQWFIMISIPNLIQSIIDSIVPQNVSKITNVVLRGLWEWPSCSCFIQFPGSSAKSSQNGKKVDVKLINIMISPCN